VRAAIASGAHVVTANKGPAAVAYAEISAAADAAGVRFLTESAVLDGIPILNLARETLPAVRIIGFRGVVNSTTNYILTAMEQDGDADEALAAMQAEGIAEADASLDVDGWDAAAKTAVLVNVLMGGRTTPAAVARTGIGGLTGERVRDAVRRGKRVKLVASATRHGDTIAAAVAPIELDATDPLAPLDGQSNAIVLATDLLGEIVITQRDGGLTQTAYGLLADVVTIRRSLSPAAGARHEPG
jgi:homoserine dehydrogenase